VVVRQNSIRLIIDGASYDLSREKAGDVLSSLLLSVLDRRMSLIGIKEMLLSLSYVVQCLRSAVIELEGSKAKKWKYQLTRMEKTIEWIQKAPTREDSLISLYNTILSFEGLGTLPGFSVTGGIQHGLLNYNPEKKSVMRYY
jgi:hypothetical protein